ncbi:discoidin domain-containing receptor 2-like isoform X1 [Limulus polyphemus]|uniref:Discoidin domain-containing receptor 2-like isoform X1 n=1 Tax=Limulus polyphemus TaxID=6850 RepID=A0ABM1T9H5_LIMPO|nr:discoidin domain-containing receptor 2-like isoform X1 [Limulus polyphemus]
MKSGDIKDEDITASSSYNDAVGPRTARLEQEVNSGAWCPSRQIDKDTYEYLEINLHSLHVITQVATQGRFGNGQGQEYAEQYKLEYWRPGVHDWIRYINRTGHEVLQGNTNTYFPALRVIDPLIIASKIRFIPHSILLRTVCMRVEVYGCPWTEGIISYSMPQGERRGLELDLSDDTYDGVKDDSYLNGGLGQLTDGVEGDDNFKADADGYGKGYEWVGWKNDSSFSRPLQIVFAFDSVRNFSSLYFHCNNMYTKDVQVFATAKLWFSIGGKYYPNDPLRFSYMADTYNDKARNVTIFLHHRIGKFVKVELTFASRWILISEVSFSSVPAQGNFTEEEPPAAPPIVSTAVNDDSLSSQYVGLVIGVLAAVILLLIIVIFIIIARNRRRKHTTPHTMLKPVENRVTINMKDLGISYSPCSPMGRQANGNVYGQVALDDADPDKLLYQEPQDFKPFGGLYSNDSTTSREYAVPDVQKPSTPLSHPPPTPVNKPPFPQTLPKSQHTPSEKHYAATDVVKLPNIQGVSGSTVYAVPNVELLGREELPIREIPRHRLKFLEKLGEGQFGEVHLCEADGIPELVDVPCYGNKTMVAVKTLRQNASDQARNDFYKEVKILSRLRDPNIVHVLGVCTREEPLAMIVEYMENGDLNQFLQQHIPEGAAYRSVSAKTLSYGSLIYMATQVASGMKYLESLNFVHRDLATRNCLVGRAYTIKVADFGMSRGLYTADYYRIEGRAMLPIRWMAWESILLGKFTTRSDVWAFAVTLWEILTFARQQPYSDLGDEQVIENVGHFYHNDGLHVLPSQPPNCPKEIYDLMRECWQRNDNDRPNFREIHLFLQRKNLGYSPQL